MAFPKVPSNLPELVKEKFHTATATSDVHFLPTEVALLHVNGVPFQLRYCSVLQKKPQPNKAKDGKKSFNPFLEPPAAQTVAEIGSPPSHVVVLNKFAIVPEHLIVVTKAFKEQTHLLEEDDIAATYACIRAYKAQGKELFAFFNSGEDSGASQPHRHIQFLPVESMKEGLDEAGWAPLAEGLLSHPPPDLPFQYFAAPLKDDPSPTELYGLYRSLYEQAFRSIDDFTFHHHGKHLVAPSDRTGPSAMSYNMAMTDRVIVLLPRRSEGIVIAPHGQQPDNPEPVALNGTTLAGTLLVKNESEWIALRQDEKKLLELLTAIGVPSSGLSVPATL